MAQRDWIGQVPPEWAIGRALSSRRPVPSDVPRRWYVGSVQPGAGAKVVEALHERDVDAYQPMETDWKRHPISKRRYRARLPIFGQYLFIGIEEGRGFGDLHDIEGLIGLLRMSIGADRQPAEIPFEFVDNLRQAEARGEFDFTRKAGISFAPGDAVAVVAVGAYEGQIGRIRRAKGEKRWQIILECMSIPLNLGEAEIEPLTRGR